MSRAIPKTQVAVQLVGKDELRLNRAKAVDRPGPHQMLARVEAVGLCFSDLKLLKQFDEHVRKSEVVSGLSPEALAEIPSYVPGARPTVPGHEVVCEIVAVGPDVRHHRVGERCLVQADYRELKTAGANAAFGYDFEGGLQQYVLLDERVVVEPSTGERLLIPVGQGLSAAAVALAEPWACVEDSYVTPERRAIKAGGRLLIVCDPGRQAQGLEAAFDPAGGPAEVVRLSREEALSGRLDGLDDESFDDIVYCGADAGVIEKLDAKLASRGVVNVVTGGARIGRAVSVRIGRVHYGMTRWIGTAGRDAAAAYRMVPANGELRPGDAVAVVGAGGPMGQMHVLRAVSCGLEGVSVVAADVDDARLEALRAKAEPLARAADVPLRLVNTRTSPLEGKFTYVALMVPAAPLVADAIAHAAPGARVNVFAGIPAVARHELNLDALIAGGVFLFGTSGSTIQDMRIVLEKVVTGRLDTNRSVDAVSGLAGAIDGIRAVENRTTAGKIIVYPQLADLPLTPLDELKDRFPTVAAKLADGSWTQSAEDELLRVAGGA